jgi:hypothetical protein
MDVAEIEHVLADRMGMTGGESDLTGPVHVLETTPNADGGSTYRVSASRLVPVDIDDPDLASVYIPVPVTAAVEVDGHDSVVGVQVTDPDPSADREARAFTRNLIANGEVKGLASGGPVRRGPSRPPPRSTHEVTTDPAGRRVIRRTGFALTFDARAQSDNEQPVDSGSTHR